MCMVACGGADVYYENGIYCWDIAAGDIIVREAGGTTLSLAGKWSHWLQNLIARAPREKEAGEKIPQYILTHQGLLATATEIAFIKLEMKWISKGCVVCGEVFAPLSCSQASPILPSPLLCFYGDLIASAGEWNEGGLEKRLPLFPVAIMTATVSLWSIGDSLDLMRRGILCAATDKLAYQFVPYVKDLDFIAK